MTKLNDKYYEGIVATDEVDPNHAGAVRIKISGVTDGLKKKELPWAIPSVVNLASVPTKGTLLEISFDEGDADWDNDTLCFKVNGEGLHELFLVFTNWYLPAGTNTGSRISKSSTRNS